MTKKYDKIGSPIVTNKNQVKPNKNQAKKTTILYQLFNKTIKRLVDIYKIYEIKIYNQVNGIQNKLKPTKKKFKNENIIHFYNV